MDIKPFIALGISMAAVLMFVVSMAKGFDLFNHYRRYRRHLLDYPANDIHKGTVWKKTK